MLSAILISAVLSSVPAQAKLARPAAADTITVHATLWGYKSEKDGDVHLVVRDSGASMIAEITPEYRDLMASIGRVKSKWVLVGRRVIVTGIGHHDRAHGQTGAAPNGREIHPVLSI